MIKARKIELLAPAKNLECGIEAINHGADAVYIGAPKFSARSSAGNNINDISELVTYAHLFNVRVYVALNTILKDNELKETETLIWQLYNIGVDALIIQDMGVTQLNLPPIPLHASTQMDNRTPEKVKFLEEAGFSQIVLARELSINEIKRIAENISTPLEFFVHGALCVSYSGQCYISEAITKRSANRGSCAQLCRLPYTLIDSQNKIIMQNKHLLSMKDLNLSENIEELLDAGISSLKIEGRLKDVTYVKNVVAYYRLKLDEILKNRPQYIRSSSGESRYLFEPILEKSFNRGFTQYFIHGGGDKNIWSLHTPKSIGEPIGKVKDIFDHFFVLSGTKKLNNGDGLCYLNDKQELAGVRVNKVDGEKVFPFEHNFKIKRGTLVYRNYDHEFEKILLKKSAERKIEVDITLREITTGFTIDIEDVDGNSVSLSFDIEKQPAQKDQLSNLITNLSKTGNTIYKVKNVNINLMQNWFIPVSLLSDWRRRVTDRLTQARLIAYRKEIKNIKQTTHKFPIENITYLGNVMNKLSHNFYVQHKVNAIENAFEIKPQMANPLMFTKHCVKRSIGLCPKEGVKNNLYKEPFFLIYESSKFQLEFDCKICEMRVLKKQGENDY